MNALLQRFSFSAFALPAGILTLIGLMVVPTPAVLLDLFFVLNIALSIAILMAAMNAQKPLDFSSFPSVLLFATLLRLSLNVASTRVVLVNGHQGGAAAGHAHPGGTRKTLMNQSPLPRFPVTDRVREALVVSLRGCEELIPEDDWVKKLARSEATGTPLRIKLGLDPTAPDIHIGHTVVLNKMRQLQDLGHQVIFLIGDFTSLIGDPSGRNTTRPPLTPEQIKSNAETYYKQASLVLDQIGRAHV